MQCPNCDRDMDIDSYNAIECYYDWERQSLCNEEAIHLKYTCKRCGITYIRDKWHVPKAYAPTEKQIGAIRYINRKLNFDIEPITKRQCWQMINKWYECAKRTHTSFYLDAYEPDMF